MGKHVSLTWIDLEDKRSTETVWLCNDDDPLIEPETSLPLLSDEGVVLTVSDICNGLVMFMDETGIFGVPPNKILSMKDV